MRETQFCCFSFPVASEPTKDRLFESHCDFRTLTRMNMKTFRKDTMQCYSRSFCLLFFSIVAISVSGTAQKMKAKDFRSRLDFQWLNLTLASR